MAVPLSGSTIILQLLLHSSKFAALDSNWSTAGSVQLHWISSGMTLMNTGQRQTIQSQTHQCNWWGEQQLMTAIPYKFQLQITRQLFSQQTATVHVNCPLKNLKCFNFLELFTHLGDHRENFLKRVRKATALLQPEKSLQTDHPSVLGLTEERAWKN